MDGNGNTIVALNANDARAKLNAARRGIQVAGVTITLWRDGQMPYTLHLTEKILMTLIVPRETEYETVAERVGVHAMAYAAGAE